MKLTNSQTVMQIDQDKLKTENTNLVAVFREKSRKHQQTQELYDRLKRKEMTAATQSAAFNSVDEVLGSISSRSGQDPNQLYQSTSRLPGQQDFSHSPVDHEQQQVHSHGRSGSNGSQGERGLMPPPPNPTNKPGNRAFEFGESNSTLHLLVLMVKGHNLSHNLPTPQYRPQLSSIQQSGSQPNTGSYVNPGRISAERLQQTPSQRQPLANVGSSSLNRSGVRGYGMSAGMKVGRQQGKSFILPKSQPSQISPVISLTFCQPRALLASRIMVKSVVEGESHTLSHILKW